MTCGQMRAHRAAAVTTQAHTVRNIRLQAHSGLNGQTGNGDIGNRNGAISNGANGNGVSAGRGYPRAMVEEWVRKTSRDSQEVEDLKRVQEKLVQVVIKDNEKSELRATRRNKERMEELKRDHEKRVERQTIENREIVRMLKQKNEASLARLLSENEVQVAEMMAKQKKKRETNQPERAAPMNQPVAPECPVCLDKMVPPTRIFQCINGHHTCEKCKSKMNSPLCPNCRKTFIGRAFGMENFLKDLSTASTTRQ